MTIDLDALDKVLSEINSRNDWNKCEKIVKDRHEKWLNKTIATPKVGDLVSFSVDSGKRYKGRYLGIVSKLNPKRVKVEVYVGKIIGLWRVGYLDIEPATKEEKVQITLAKMERNNK